MQPKVNNNSLRFKLETNYHLNQSYMKKLLLLCSTLLLVSLMQAQVNKTVNCISGSLSSLITLAEDSTITNLTITGTIDVRDFRTIQSLTNLSKLDISNVTISILTSNDTIYEANELPANAFNMENISSVILPYSITTIGSNAFGGCFNLTSVTIPASVTLLRDNAFNDCGIESITIPSTVKTVGFGAFMSCTNLKTLTIEKGVQSIGDDCFDDCINLQTINLAVEKIGEYAFNSCQNIQTVIFNDGVKTIGKFAFNNCILLNSVTFPSSVDSVADYAFMNCSGMISLSLNEGLRSIGFNSFQACNAISGLITIPSTIKYIGINAFGGDTSITSLTIKNGIDTINISIFGNCFGIKGALIIPPSVKFINSGAFNSDTNITSLSIPASVDSISGGAFYNCNSLKSIYAYSVKPIALDETSEVFNGVDTNNCILYVPYGSKTAYQVANQWKSFKNIQELNTISLSQTSLTFTDSFTIRKVFISTNAPWNAVFNSNWLTVSPTSGTGSDTIVITALANTGDTRTASITITSDAVVSLKADIEQTITVTQAGGTKTATVDNNIDFISMYPNPAKSSITINTGKSAYIELYDITGQKILTMKTSGIETIPLTVPAGFYLLNIITDNGIVTKRLRKE
jgi:hypothetical protein